MSGYDLIDLVKVARAHKAKQINKSIQAKTYFQNRANNIGENLKTSKKLGVTSQEHELRSTYYDMLDRYYHKSTFKFFKVNEKSVKFWRKVADLQSSSGVDCNTYIKAQFYWFDKHFKTAPSLQHLITENALKRAMEFSGCKGNVVSSAVPYKAELPSVLQATDKMIRNIMKAQKITKEEFYVNLVITGEVPVPQAYLDADPLFKRYLKLAKKCKNS